MNFKTLAVLSAAALTVATLASEPAEARSRRGNVAGAVAAGVIGGVALGAIAAGTAAQAAPVYVAPAPVYVAPAPVYVAPTARTTVTTRDYGHCYVRNVTTVDDWGRRVVRRTKYC